MPLTKVRKLAMRQVAKWMASEKAMQVLSDPRVQKVMAQAFTFQEEITKRWNRTLREAAKRLNLATLDDLATLKRAVRKIEGQVSTGGDNR